jgi:hypothetical protein
MQPKASPNQTGVSTPGYSEIASVASPKSPAFSSRRSTTRSLSPTKSSRSANTSQSTSLISWRPASRAEKRKETRIKKERENQWDSSHALGTLPDYSPLFDPNSRYFFEENSIGRKIRKSKLQTSQHVYELRKRSAQLSVVRPRSSSPTRSVSPDPREMTPLCESPNQNLGAKNIQKTSQLLSKMSLKGDSHHTAMTKRRPTTANAGPLPSDVFWGNASFADAGGKGEWESFAGRPLGASNSIGPIKPTSIDPWSSYNPNSLKRQTAIYQRSPPSTHYEAKKNHGKTAVYHPSRDHHHSGNGHTNGVPFVDHYCNASKKHPRGHNQRYFEDIRLTANTIGLRVDNLGRNR